MCSYLGSRSMLAAADLPPYCEVSWLSVLCENDYEFLGFPDVTLQSFGDHTCNIALSAERKGFDRLLLPSGYNLGLVHISALVSSMAPTLRQTFF